LAFSAVAVEPIGIGHRTMKLKANG
jgi:hypothetical protein